MSQENVEIAKDMDAWSGFLAPDVIWRVQRGWPEPCQQKDAAEKIASLLTR